jgi:hypothetical protein
MLTPAACGGCNMDLSFTFQEPGCFFGQFPGRGILIYAGAAARRTDLVPDSVSWSISWELDSKAARQA